jgi:hypothetical protein
MEKVRIITVKYNLVEVDKQFESKFELMTSQNLESIESNI